MANKKNGNGGNGKEKLNLETATNQFSEACEKCGEKLSVHAYRQKTQSKKEAIYASCLNKGKCGRYQTEICFIEKYF